MVLKTFSKAIFGSRNERVLKRLGRVVKRINAIEPEIQALDDDTLKNKTADFRQRLNDGAKLDSLLVEAFAVVREVSRRTLGLRHFDVQLIGGMVLHEGNIAEMRTGEGKTLMSTLAAYLNALPAKGVHIVTVNDYLAKRDADWMRPVFEFLGLTVGVNLPDMSPEDKREAYAADITYGTNNEFGFDYLRDNMALSLEDRVQRGRFFAVVDEVDSILIDEARTPLIISGQAEGSAEDYVKVNAIIPKLIKREEEDGAGDFYLDEKQKQVHLTEEGHEHVEELLAEAGLIQEGQTLYDPQNIAYMHYLNALLRAHHLYQKDVEYVVNAAREVVIVDEHTGRTMPGRRWSDGLHQAIEAKEGVPIQNENQTLASITFQNFFRLYEKLSGMTGTADTEAYEFQQIYALEVIVIPTNRKIQRIDYADKIYLTAKGKYDAVVEEVKQAQEKGQPVLVGTASIEASEYLSSLMKKAGIKHQVLNAKYHEKEASIIQEAGRPGAVTIATNMAGRGTDIVLGGNLEAEIHALGEAASEADIQALREDWKQRNAQVLASGGLHIVGSERHESRRIDNQLRGRSGRQGDAGSSRFYLSLEDHLMRIFASPRVAGMMRRLGMKENEAIEHGIISRAIENAQRKVESYHFDIRKSLLEYDDVANDQRKVVYEQRDELLTAAEVKDTVEAILRDVVEEVIERYIPKESLEEQWDVKGLDELLAADFGLHLNLQAMIEADDKVGEDALREAVFNAFESNISEKRAQIGDEGMNDFERTVMLQTLDSHWKDHLAAMDHLRQGIHLRGYAQKDPKREYKIESFRLFSSMLDGMKYEMLQILINAQAAPEDVDALNEARRQALANQQFNYHFTGIDEQLEADAHESFERESGDSVVAEQRRVGEKVGRNDPCPCGSGKKYKQCHGKLS